MVTCNKQGKYNLPFLRPFPGNIFHVCVFIVPRYPTCRRLVVYSNFSCGQLPLLSHLLWTRWLNSRWEMKYVMCIIHTHREKERCLHLLNPWPVLIHEGMFPFSRERENVISKAINTLKRQQRLDGTRNGHELSGTLKSLFCKTCWVGFGHYDAISCSIRNIPPRAISVPSFEGRSRVGNNNVFPLVLILLVIPIVYYLHFTALRWQLG